MTVAAAVADYLAYLRTHDGKDIDAKTMRFREHLTPHLAGRPLRGSQTTTGWPT